MQVLLLLERDADRALERLRPTRAALAEQRRRLGPVDRLGDAGSLAEWLAPQLADGGNYGTRRRLGDAGGAQHDDAGLALRRGVVDPVIDAAPTQGLVQVARPVRRERH